MMIVLLLIIPEQSNSSFDRAPFFDVVEKVDPYPISGGAINLQVIVTPNFKCEEIILEIIETYNLTYFGPVSITKPGQESVATIFDLPVIIPENDTSGISFIINKEIKERDGGRIYWVVEEDTVKTFDSDPRQFISTILRNREDKIITVQERRIAEGGPIDPMGDDTTYYTDGKGSVISKEEYENRKGKSNKVYAPDEGLDDTAYVWKRGEDGKMYQVKKTDLPTNEPDTKEKNLSFQNLSGADSFIKYEIKEVIEIGPLNRATYDPIKWSANDSLVSYFANGYLMLTDTMGNKREVAKLDMGPHCVEWLSEKEIVVSMYRTENRQTKSKIVIFNIETGGQEIFAEFQKRIGYGPGPEDQRFEGPYLTLEGNVYYITGVGNGKVTHLIPSSYKNISSEIDNHFYRSNPNGLYIVRLDMKDSISAFAKSYTDTIKRFDRAYIFNNKLITRLSDSTIIDLSPYIGEYPEGTLGCGLGREALNPNIPEALFMLSCDNGVDYIVNRIGIFNYYDNQFTILDTLIGIKSCQSPKYDHAGKNIAFFANGNLYIIKRGAVQ
ncbi:MAG: hypothetical protein PHU88_01195 [candidate division Zixibacteria bacterium]|nr:hypothetical protein [candidate division Zixibacteria bacterium]